MQQSTLGLFTDFYELTMAQGYFLKGHKNTQATFDYFFRKAPFKAEYAVFSGLSALLEALEDFSFSAEDIGYLKTQGFKEPFLDYLKDFRFSGTILAPREGEIVFGNAPIVRVDAPIIEAQLIETLLLNILNFSTLIATKTHRILQAAGGRPVIDFGLRRAQGMGGMLASRAAIGAGAMATSNVLAGKKYGLPVSGTMAHAWIQSYDDELQAFRDFVEVFPNNGILLVDTYHTLKSGIPNAIKVAHEMKAKGHELKAIRLDSGDLAYLSKKARKMLDEAGLPDVKIVVSNQLDEHLIQSLLNQKAPLDIFGVGTSLVTGQPDAALDGVYKLAESQEIPRMKLSENVEKVTLPGKKQLFRLLDKEGKFYADVLTLDGEGNLGKVRHPWHPDKSFDGSSFKSVPLTQPVIEDGKRMVPIPSAEEIANYTAEQLQLLPEEHKRFDNPHAYKVGISSALYDLRDRLLSKNRMS